MQHIFQEIYLYGGEILRSAAFHKCISTTHHKHSNVARHSIAVAVCALQICHWLNRHHIRTDNHRMVLAALGHDLAMPYTAQYGKVLGKFTTAFRHPSDSAAIVADITDVHKSTYTAIKRHMWPLCIIPPNSLEGWILTLADKIVAIKELVPR